MPVNRERALKVLLALVGLFFVAGIYPLITSMMHPKQSDYPDQMILAVYATLGVFLLLAVRNPAANRSLIAFTAWSSLAHAAVMTGAINPDWEPTHRAAAPRCGRNHLPDPDRADPSTAVRPTCIGLRLKADHFPQTACCARTRPRQCDHTNHAEPTTSSTTTTMWKRWKISLNRGSLSQWFPSRIPA